MEPQTLAQQFHLRSKELRQPDLETDYVNQNLCCKEYSRYKSGQIPLVTNPVSEAGLTLGAVSTAIQATELLTPTISDSVSLTNTLLGAFELYVLLPNATDIPASLYHCSRIDSALVPLPFAFNQFYAALTLNDSAIGSKDTAFICITARTGLVIASFGDRGYRQLVSEVGKITERIKQAGNTTHLSCVEIQDIPEIDIESLLHIDGTTEIALSTLKLTENTQV